MMHSINFKKVEPITPLTNWFGFDFNDALCDMKNVNNVINAKTAVPVITIFLVSKR